MQHGREVRSNWTRRREVRSNFKNKRCLIRENQSLSYVNQHESVSHIQIRHAYDFSLCFLHELLMSFLNYL
jgi:hypothetical protein